MLSELLSWPFGMHNAVGSLLHRLAVFPFDVIKSKIQTDSLHDRQYKGVLDCARKVCQIAVEIFERPCGMRLP